MSINWYHDHFAKSSQRELLFSDEQDDVFASHYLLQSVDRFRVRCNSQTWNQQARIAVDQNGDNEQKQSTEYSQTVAVERIATSFENVQ